MPGLRGGGLRGSPCLCALTLPVWVQPFKKGHHPVRKYSLLIRGEKCTVCANCEAKIRREAAGAPEIEARAAAAAAAAAGAGGAADTATATKTATTATPAPTPPSPPTAARGGSVARPRRRARQPTEAAGAAAQAARAAGAAGRAPAKSAQPATTPKTAAAARAPGKKAAKAAEDEQAAKAAETPEGRQERQARQADAKLDAKLKKAQEGKGAGRLSPEEHREFVESLKAPRAAACTQQETSVRYSQCTHFLKVTRCRRYNLKAVPGSHGLCARATQSCCR